MEFCGGGGRKAAANVQSHMAALDSCHFRTSFSSLPLPPFQHLCVFNLKLSEVSSSSSWPFASWDRKRGYETQMHKPVQCTVHSASMQLEIPPTWLPSPLKHLLPCAFHPEDLLTPPVLSTACCQCTDRMSNTWNALDQKWFRFGIFFGFWNICVCITKYLEGFGTQV